MHCGDLRKRGKHPTPFPPRPAWQGSVRASIPTHKARPSSPYTEAGAVPAAAQGAAHAGKFGEENEPGPKPPRPAAVTARGPGPPDAVSRGSRAPPAPGPASRSLAAVGIARRRQRPLHSPATVTPARPRASPQRRAARERPGSASGCHPISKDPPFSARHRRPPRPAPAAPAPAAPPRLPQGAPRDLPRRSTPTASGPAGNGEAAGPTQHPPARGGRLPAGSPRPF